MGSRSNLSKEINILLMGETGVGKSTFINAFANYLTFNKLEDVKDNLVCLIPTKFTVTDDDFKECTISIGKNDNEGTEAGKSATKSCRSYNFYFGEQLVRLIDTPGVGDTGGIDQDAKNFQNILSHISVYTEIHGICILLKPNNARLTATFQFCIKELLCHLHKSASRNIIFLFTNSRGTFYKPGDTSRGLREMLTEISEKPPNVDIKFNKDNTFCFDSESFRFIVALLHGITFEEDEKKNFSLSWDKSVSQCRSLISYIRSLEPHNVQDTLSVNQARNLIIALAKPLADISENIQVNLAVLLEQKKKINSSVHNISGLQTQLYIPVIRLEKIPLTGPQTVCASASCIKVNTYLGQRQFNYVTECHSPCYLDSVPQDIIGQPELLGCAAMFLGTCRKCKCHWSAHMHIWYKLLHVEEKIIDENTQTAIRSKEEAKNKAELKVKELDQRREQLLKEQDIITKTCAGFGYFLKNNAITPYNDSLKNYLDHLIEVKKMENQVGSENTDIIKGLQNMKNIYAEELKILDGAMTSNNDNQKPITASSISTMANDLYNLEINGPTIKYLMNELNTARTREHFKHREYTYQPPSNDWTMGALYRSIEAGIKEYLDFGDNGVSKKSVGFFFSFFRR